MSLKLASNNKDPIVNDLKKKVKGEVRFDSYTRALYSTDASIYQIEPIGLVIPRDSNDVIAALETAWQAGVAILPRGAGTSLAGQAVNRAIVLDFSKYMNRVLSVNAEERSVYVQPGITIENLNKSLYPYGLHFAPDPTTADRATVGGAIGNNSCGSHSVLYGKTLDHVEELDVVLSDGSQASFTQVTPSELDSRLKGATLESAIYRRVKGIVEENYDEIERRFPKLMRRVGGYNLDEFVRNDSFDLSRLVVGSEGTLCTVVQAKLNLMPLPHVIGLAVLHFTTLDRAMEAIPGLMNYKASAIELVDKMILDQARQSVPFARLADSVEGDPGALLLVEMYGDTDNEVQVELKRLCKQVKDISLAYAANIVIDPKAQARVWALRKAGLGLLMGVRGDNKPLPFVEDTAVDPQKLQEYVRRFDEIVRNNGTVAAYYGHASVGCLHVRPVINLKMQDGIDQMTAISKEISDLVLEFGGALSGEHGDGIVRGVWNEHIFGTQLYNAFREVKEVFDPKGIMNPGKIVDCPPMTENLRYGPSYTTLDIDSHLDFSSQGGFQQAVELCNGVGACRKSSGTMCPSYMATNEEEASTRGRANALRGVLSGFLPSSEFTGKRLYQILDLCLGCKGCKVECPSGVDMAKLKHEFLAHYYRDNRMPLRNRFFGHIGIVNYLGCLLAPLSNWIVQSVAGRWLMERVLSVDKRRRPPSFARPTFSKLITKRIGSTQRYRGKVVFFNDTFTEYNYPQAGIAAMRVLEAAGFQVIIPRRRCCGRPMISQGMMRSAVSSAKYNVRALHTYAKQGIPVVGLEPSCVLMLREEYPDLLKTDEARQVAENSYTFDEFLKGVADRGDLELHFKDVARKVLFQGHCHQKVMTGTSSSMWLLSLIPGYEVEEIDAGCCGMAGSFGYEKEHYDVSISIANLNLFPTIIAHKDSFLAVTGASCRQQIEHGTGRQARHVAELLAEALEEF